MISTVSYSLNRYGYAPNPQAQTQRSGYTYQESKLVELAEKILQLEFSLKRLPKESTPKTLGLCMNLNTFKRELAQLLGLQQSSQLTKQDLQTMPVEYTLKPFYERTMNDLHAMSGEEYKTHVKTHVTDEEYQEIVASLKQQ